MKIVIAVHHFPPRHTGGAELRAYRTASRLRDLGCQVHIVCVERIDVDSGSGLVFEDTTYDGLPVRRLGFHLAKTPDPFLWRYDNPWIGDHLQGYLAELAPDLLHLISGYLMSGSTLRAAADLQIPTVVTLTDFWFLCPRITLLRSNGRLCAPPFDPVVCARCLGEQKRRYRIPGRIVPGLMRIFWAKRSDRVDQVWKRMVYLRETLNGVNAVISPSRFLRDLFIEAGVEPGRIVFSRQGRDFPDLRSEDLIKSSAGHLRVGYTGQIAPHKGVHTLFEAVQQLPDIDLEVRVYGDTSRFPDYARLLRRMADRDTRLMLAGIYRPTEVSQVLQHLDVVVVPSVWYENSPNTILEAFAHRTPVIVSNLGGMAELVQDGVNGLRFTPGEPLSLAARLRQLIDDPRLLARLQKGIALVKSVADEMRELSDIYRAVGSPDGGTQLPFRIGD